MSAASENTSNSEISEIESDFRSFASVVPQKTVQASRLTTFRIGGTFQFYIEPDSIKELSEIVKWSRRNQQRLNVLGFGSNLLADSKGVNGWTLHLGRSFRNIKKLPDNIFRVGAGYSLSTLSREVSLDGFSGLEFAAGIPGSVGGATRMNAGAHRGEMSSIITAVEGIDSEGNSVRYKNDELEFGYRNCSLPKDFLITSVELNLHSSDSAQVMKTLSSNLEYRKKTQPLSLPSAGSVFRNPGSTPEMSAGAIIEKLGLKGKSNAAAEISNLHANWIVNPRKSATSSDVVALIELCKSEAKQQMAIDLQTEIVMW